MIYGLDREETGTGDNDRLTSTRTAGVEGGGARECMLRDDGIRGAHATSRLT